MYADLFPARLKKAREMTKFTQREVAKELQISQASLAQYETGRSQPDIETLGKLIDHYQTTADWIIGTQGINISIKELRERADILTKIEKDRK